MKHIGSVRIGLLAIAFVFAAAGMAAQTVSQPAPGTGMEVTQTVPSHTSDGKTQGSTRTLSTEEVGRLMAAGGKCPVSVSASQRGTAWNREVGDGHAAGARKEAGQLVYLSVAARDARRVVAATVTVHGFWNKGRMVETLEAQEPGSQSAGDAARTLEVTFGTPDAQETAAELAVPGFSAVTSVELKSITYADGSIWTVTAAHVCSARIDPLMLVDGR